MNPYYQFEYKQISGKKSKTTHPEYPDMLSNFRWHDVSAENELEIFIVKPVKIKFSGEATENNKEYTIKGNCEFLIDFGREFAGWLEIDATNLNGEVLLGVSEYNEYQIVNYGPQNPVKLKTPTKYRDTETYRLELNEELYEGVRFGFIFISNISDEFVIKNIRLICQIKPCNYNSIFDTDNKILKKIWYHGAYAIRSNLKKDYFAAVTVDRGDRFSWTGDAYPAQDGSLVAFCNYDFILHNLKHTATHKNDIPTYELYWLLSVVNYYIYTGDASGVISLKEEIKKRIIESIQNFDTVGDEVNLNYVGWDERLGAGFENPNRKNNKIIYKFLVIRAVKKCIEYLPIDITKDFADTKIPTLKNSDFGKISDIHSAAEAILSDEISHIEAKNLYSKYFTDNVQRLSYSPFNQYFILQAQAKIGKLSDMVQTIIDMYKGQIDYGASGYFELFRPSWNKILKKNSPPVNCQTGHTSLNHPWGSGVIKLLHEEILGIKPLKPGFEEFVINPFTQGLNTISGEISTPKGKISVNMNLSTGKLSVIIPDNTICHLYVPKNGYSILNKGGAYNFNFAPFNKADLIKESTFVYSTKMKFSSPKNKEFKFFYLNEKNKNLPSYIEKIEFNKALYNEKGFFHSNYNFACHQTFTIDIYSKNELKIILHFKDIEKLNIRQAVEIFDLKTLYLLSEVKRIDDFSEGKFLNINYKGSIRIRINHIRGEYAMLNGIYFEGYNTQNML